MKKPIFRLATGVLLFTSCALSNLNAQVTVGGNSAPRATLDVVAIPSYTEAQGVIAPNLAISVLDANQAAYTAAQTGAIVYVDNVSAGSNHAKTAAVTKVGYYYFDGAVWQPMGSGSGGGWTYKAGNNGVDIDFAPYNVADDETFLLFNIATSCTVVLPSGVPEGHMIYIANRGHGTLNFSPPPIPNIGYETLNGAVTAGIMKTYAGWLIVTGY